MASERRKRVAAVARHEQVPVLAEDLRGSEHGPQIAAEPAVHLFAAVHHDRDVAVEIHELVVQEEPELGQVDGIDGHAIGGAVVAHGHPGGAAAFADGLGIYILTTDAWWLW